MAQGDDEAGGLRCGARARNVGGVRGVCEQLTLGIWSLYSLCLSDTSSIEQRKYSDWVPKVRQGDMDLPTRVKSLPERLGCELGRRINR